jgi:hypothetical protein
MRPHSRQETVPSNESSVANVTAPASETALATRPHRPRCRIRHAAALAAMSHPQR